MKIQMVGVHTNGQQVSDIIHLPYVNTMEELIEAAHDLISSQHLDIQDCYYFSGPVNAYTKSGYLILANDEFNFILIAGPDHYDDSMITKFILESIKIIDDNKELFRNTRH